MAEQPEAMVLIGERRLRRVIAEELSRLLNEVREDRSYLGTHDVGRLLGIHAKSAARLARTGELRAVRVGRSWRFSRADLDAFMKGRRNDQADP